jgi:hypothetical protein
MDLVPADARDPFDALPDETLMHVLSIVGNRDTESFLTARGVSRRWRQVIRDASWHLDQTVLQDEFTSGRIDWVRDRLEAALVAQNLGSVHVELPWLSPALIMLMLVEHAARNVKTLTLSAQDYPDFSIAGRLTALVKLDINFESLHNDRQRYLSGLAFHHVTTSCTALEDVGIVWARFPALFPAARIACSNCLNLRRLNLEMCLLGPGDIASTSLRELKIIDARVIGADVIERLGEDCPNLIAFCTNRAPTHAIATLLTRLSATMRAVKINTGVRMEMDELPIVRDALMQCRQLEYADLTYYNNDEDEAEVVDHTSDSGISLEGHPNNLVQLRAPEALWARWAKPGTRWLGFE